MLGTPFQRHFCSCVSFSVHCDDKGVFDGLHRQLKMELHMVTFQKFTERIKFFENLNPECIAFLSNRLGTRIYLPNELVIIQATLPIKQFCKQAALLGSMDVLTANGRQYNK